MPKLCMSCVRKGTGLDYRWYMRAEQNAVLRSLEPQRKDVVLSKFKTREVFGLVRLSFEFHLNYASPSCS